MKLRPLLLFSPIFLPISALADAVVYTDAQHPPVNITSDTQIVWLDGPMKLQAQWFGELPADPQQAALQAKSVMQSPLWMQQEQQLVASWRGVMIFPTKNGHRPKRGSGFQIVPG